MKAYLVDESLAGQRLDVAVTILDSGLTRTRVQKLLADGLITVNNTVHKASYRVSAGDHIIVTVPPVRAPQPQPEAIDLKIIYEDDDVLVLNKPKGLVVHPAAGHSGGTLVNALLHHCRELSGIGGEARPGIVHRLDKDTSGVLVVTKNDRAHLSLATQFREHTVTREYVAIVHGEVQAKQGIIDAPIARDPKHRKKMAVCPEGRGRRAVTRFCVLERLPGYTLLALRLETGRTHQIRVHMASIGHPVVGDSTYGPRKTIMLAASQALHARLLGFRHPADGRYLEFKAEAPPEFHKLLERLRYAGGKGRQEDEG